MYTLIVENKYGQQLELSHNDAYVITSIDGLDPPDATINTTKNANSDGSVFNSSHLNDRQIIITMAINSPAEVNRIALYQYFKTKMPLTLYYQNSSRNVYINGYVQRMNVEFFNKKQIAQITIDCPNPYFLELATSENKISNILDGFEFPFSIEMGNNLIPFPYYNDSKVSNGITWTVNDDGTITANGTASARVDFFMAYNVTGLFGRGNYILSGCPNGGSNNTYRMQLYDATNRVTYNDFGNGIRFTIDASNENSQFRILASVFQNETVDNLTFKPMVNVGSSALPYEQYTAPGVEFSTMTTDPIEVLNDGDVETGGVITIRALDSVTNPTVYNETTNEQLTVNVTMNEGDEIIINTIEKQKSATLIRANGDTSNAIGLIAPGSTWLKLIPGINDLQVLSGGEFTDAAYVLLDFNGMYEGV